jgi:hypothetical protein
MKGSIAISRFVNYDGKYPIRITVEDDDAVINFVEINMTLEDFANALMGSGMMDCEIVVRNLENVGKKREQDTIIFEMPKSDHLVYGDDRKEIAKKLAQDACPNGWGVSESFSSQNSFFSKGGKDYARAFIVRWIEK